jgi:para-nitrobenzyl esterase
MRLWGLLVALAACGGSGDGLTVTIDTGTLHGGQTGTIRHFLSIPYAAPPVGDLRWRAPQPPAPWEGTREALQVLDQCPQSLSYSGPSNVEDCLFLNVWTPVGAHDLPVMVWLHGGAFIFGSGFDKYYAGDHLAEKGVVVVTLNYRLGAFGFMALPQLDTEDPDYPTSGNYGLEDQRAALAWVQRNIAAFGGDPSKVTLFGESAGGFSACVQYFSSRTTDLFGAAIVESGLCGASILENTHQTALDQGTALAQQLGCTSGDVLACMRGVDAQTLLDMTALPKPESQVPGGPFYQTAILANGLPNVDGVVIEKPLSMATPSASRPLVLGTNKDEGTLFHASIYATAVADETEYRAALAVRFPGKVDAIVAQYPVASYPSANDALAAVTGDAFFVCPARRTARIAQGAGNPTYLYSFEHALEHPFYAGLGVFHSSDIPFVFGNDNYPLGKIGSATALVDAIQGYWTELAIAGSIGDWPAWTPEAEDYLRFDDAGASSQQHLKSAVCDFWDAL